MVNQQKNQNNYDPRYFIWTIVFLVATGITLVTYIVTTNDSGNSPSGEVTTKTLSHK